MKKYPLLQAVLQEQQTLTAVERFAELHDKNQVPHQAKYYKALLPAAPPGPGQQYAFEVNLDACSGCKACVTACHNLNGLDGQETWRFVGLLQGKKTLGEGAERTTRVAARPVWDVDTKPLAAITHFQQHVTTACHHCVEPSCLTGCPVNAYEKDKVTGIVKHLDDQCIGCQYCTYTCSYNVPQYNPARGVVRKCDMCAGRLSQGEAPACVQACPNEAIRITLVNTEETRASPGKNFAIPGSPDPRHSLPTTQYKSSRRFPENARAADHDVLAPQPPEIPLVIMLVLTQVSVGLFGATAFLGFSTDAATAVAVLTAAVLGFAGLGASTLHLGRPLYAFRVVVGLGHSWLSREAVVLGLFGALAGASAALHIHFLGLHIVPAPLLERVLPWRGPLLTAAAAVGLLGVFCSAMIYLKTPRAWWMSKVTLAKFFLTTFRGGLLFALAIQVITAWTLGLTYHLGYFICAGLVSVTVVKLAFEAQVLRHLKDPTLTDLKKTALLLTGIFRAQNGARLLLGITATVVIPIALTVLPFYPENAAFLVLASVVCFLAGELLERHLFFRAVVPPKMPGSI